MSSQDKIDASIRNYEIEKLQKQFDDFAKIILQKKPEPRWEIGYILPMFQSMLIILKKQHKEIYG
tara:strand:- start:397 stop:591 length:195 start_codon:yes stop_codon:yes gene_type:complete